MVVGSRVAAVCRRIRRVLAGRFAVREVDSRLALERALHELAPSVAILDVKLDGLRGMTDVTRLWRLAPKTRFILVGDDLRPDVQIAGILAGARGYCDFHTDSCLIQKAIEAVQKGEIWVSRQVVTQVLEQASRRRDVNVKGDAGVRLEKPFAGLGRREREVAKLVMLGLSNKDIAVRLGLEVSSVKAHLTSAFRKTGVSSRLELALLLKHLQETRPDGVSAPGSSKIESTTRLGEDHAWG